MDSTQAIHHDFRASEDTGWLIEAAQEVAERCFTRMGLTLDVPLTVTYLDESTSNAFWRSPRGNGLQRATGTDVLSNAITSATYIPEEGRLVLQVDALIEWCPCCFDRAFTSSLFRHLLHTQVPWPTVAYLKMLLSENMAGACRVLQALGEEVKYEPEAVAAAIFAEWMNPREGALPIEVQDGAEDQIIDILLRYEVDLDYVRFHSYSWLLELGEELFGDLLDLSTQTDTFVAIGDGEL